MFSKIKRTIREFRKLKHLAYHDSLTGLLNRNWLYKDIAKRAYDFKYVYFLDINDLRIINRHGHTFGDEHIKDAVSSVNLKGDDKLIRYAGDEFILLSNRLNAIKTNKLFAVGFAVMSYDFIRSINRADCDMIKEKKNFKKKQ